MHQFTFNFFRNPLSLYRGGFSIVVEGTKKKSGEKFAIKCIKKTMVEGDDIKLLRREIHIMKKVNHPNILKLFEVFESDDEFFLVMEL
jgi:calcium-dependent protein kinase